jgi:predicted ATP-binding protein involved in virulence
MEIQRLTLSNVRAFEQVTFEFQSGMNLLVGINGAGKSTVLDVLRVALSQVLPRISKAKRVALKFRQADIHSGSQSFRANIEFMVAEIPFRWSLEFPLSQRSSLKPASKVILQPLKERGEQPLVVYFAPGRSVIDDRTPSATATNGDEAAAFADALKSRRLRLREFAYWYLAQETLRSEGQNAVFSRRQKALEDAISSFLDGYSNLRAISQPQATLLIDKGNITLDVHQLSDGERNIIALVFDLARRLTFANPGLDDPLREGQALVLIDELDLHLHPSWQRTIVDRLTRTFPRCQFIATTHSPQIIGEVRAENIVFIEDGKTGGIDQSWGMDANWILRRMGVSERDEGIKQRLTDIESLIENESFEEALSSIDTLQNDVGSFPTLTRLRTLADFELTVDENVDEDDSEVH